MDEGRWSTNWFNYNDTYGRFFSNHSMRWCSGNSWKTKRGNANVNVNHDGRGNGNDDNDKNEVDENEKKSPKENKIIKQKKIFLSILRQ